MAHASHPQDRPLAKPPSPGEGAAGSHGEFGAPSALLGEWDAPPTARSPQRAAPDLGAILRQKWLILGVSVLISTAAVPPIWLLTSPVYRSNAVVQVAPIVSRLVYRTDENGQVPFYDSYLNTQVAIIRSPTVLQRVLDNEKVKNSFWYREEGRSSVGQPLPPMERLTDDLSVQPRPRTHLIDVSISAGRAEDAKLIVDTVVSEYLNHVTDASTQEEAKLLETLKIEQSRRENSLKGLRQMRDNLSEHPEVSGSQELRTLLGSRLGMLESRRADLVREVELMQWKLARLQPTATAPSTAPSLAEVPPETEADRFARDEEWRQLNARSSEDQHALAIARQHYGEIHPKIRDLAATAEYSERRLRERELQIRSGVGVPDLSTQPSDLHSAGRLADLADPRVLTELMAARQEEIRLLDRDIREQRAKAGNAEEYGRVENLIRHEEEVFNDVSRRVNVLEMERKSPARIDVVAQGMLASKPSKDRRLLMSAMAVCAALAGGVALGYLRALSDPRIHVVSQLRQFVQVPFLGELPLVPAKELPRLLGGLAADANGSGSHQPVPASRAGALMEGVRVIRTALIDRLAECGPHVLLVTSPMPRSGKTSFAILLADSLASLGRRVLLVEVDMRRPCLAERLRVAADLGLADLLQGRAGDRGAIARVGQGSFDVLPAGRVGEGFDLEMLSNGVFSESLARWKGAYDFILLDGPPVMGLADARILAGHCDATVMVMRAAHDQRAESVEAYAALADTGKRVLGTVLIGGRSRGGYGYAGGYYDGYGDQGRQLRHGSASEPRGAAGNAPA